MIKMVTTVIIVIGTLLALLGQSGSVSIEEDLTISSKQKLILDDFKKIVQGRLPHPYMYEDLFLIRWLRAQDFRIKDAETMLMTNLEWRNENRMDQAVDEAWRNDLRKAYKYYIDGEDKQGRPIVYIDAGDWDLRRAVIAGQAPKIRHFIDSIFEEMMIKLRKMRIDEGKNVTQFYIIFDLDGFNLIQTGCPRCIPLIIGILTTYQNYYPGTCHKIMGVNVPEIFQPILQVLKSLMIQSTKDILYVYGRTETTNEATSKLLEDIDSDQLYYELGGTRELPY